MRRNDEDIQLRKFLFVLLHRKKPFLIVLSILSFFLVLTAVVYPLKYESQLILERKPIKISSQMDQGVEEFDVNRLTSELQRNISLLKSRMMMDSWFEAIGLKAKNSLDKEKQIKKLAASLAVQPVNYTDVLILKVKDSSPEEASRRVGLLANLYTDWDANQNKEQAEELINLLQKRQEAVKASLIHNLNSLKQFKSRQSLSLSGSNTEKELETDINGSEKLYNMINIEMENAERLHGDSAKRIHVIAPPISSYQPVHSRFVLLILALCGSWIISLLFIFLQEFHNPLLHQPEDLYKLFPFSAVYSIPPQNDASNFENKIAVFLGPVRDIAVGFFKEKSSLVFQVISLKTGDGKSTLSAALSRLLSSEIKVCLVHRSPEGESSAANGTSQTKNSNRVQNLTVNMDLSVSKLITDLKLSNTCVLIDNDSIEDMLPGSDQTGLADILCVVVGMGATPISYLLNLKRSLGNSQNPKIIFLINKFSGCALK